MRVQLKYETDDWNTGTFGWVVSSIGKKDISNYEFYPCITAELLTHDILEHPYKFTPVCDELSALGAYLAHRGDIGSEATRDAVVGDIQSALETMQEYTTISSRNSKIKDYLESSIWHKVDLGYEEIDIEDKLLKKVIYSCISHGYNRVKGIEKKYDIDFSLLYLEVLHSLELLLQQDYEYLQTDKVTVDINIKTYGVSIVKQKPVDFNYWDPDYRRYWKEERVICRH